MWTKKPTKSRKYDNLIIAIYVDECKGLVLEIKIKHSALHLL